MKLVSICERRGKYEPYHFFHGFADPRSVAGVLNHGVTPGKWGGNKDAMRGSDPEARSFWARGVEMALFYGKYVVEAVFNLRNQEMVYDEDALGIYDSPSAGASDEDWDEYFDTYFPDLHGKLRDKLQTELRAIRDAGITDDDPILRGWMRKNGKALGQLARDKYRAAGRVILPGSKSSSRTNTMYSKPIGFRGRNRIVGLYHFAPTSGNEYVCDKVYYNKGGSLKIGDTAIPKTDWV